MASWTATTRTFPDKPRSAPDCWDQEGIVLAPINNRCSNAEGEVGDARLANILVVSVVLGGSA
jgi:hypothetical protein